MGYLFERYAPGWDWWDSIYDDAKAIGALMGWDVRDIEFSGFWSQGDGARFLGVMDYAPGCAKAVRAYAPKETDLHEIAARWQALQRRCFYQLTVSVHPCRYGGGCYVHENTVSFTAEHKADSWRELPAGAEDEAGEIARDFMRWIYGRLETEYEYQQAWNLAQGWQEAGQDMKEAGQEARSLIRDLRALRRAGAEAPERVCRAIRSQVRAILAAREAARETRDSIADDFAYWQDGRRYDVAGFAAEHL